MKLSAFKTNYEAMDAGVWVSEIPLPYFAGVRLKVRRLGNPDYIDMMSKLNSARPRDKRGALVADDAEAERIVDQCLKRTVILGWDGIDEPFSPDQVDAIFADRTLHDAFRGAIVWAAGKVAEDAAIADEADAKNLPVP